MRPFPKQIAAITQHAMQPEQTTWPKTSAILWGLGRKFGMAGWYWVWVWVEPPQNCSNRKFYVTFVSDAGTAEKCQRNKLQKLWQPSINSWRNATKYDKTP